MPLEDLKVFVLVIEDDEDDFILLCDVLNEIEGLDASVERAASVEQGRLLLAQNVHDICLLDYYLGAETGILLLEEIPEIGFTSPIIFLTGTKDRELDTRALEAGAVDYLYKGDLDSERLSAAIRYALLRHDAEKERVERLKAEASNRAKSEFIAHLSHELRSPLAAILGYAELLEHEMRGNETQSYARVIHRNGKHLLSLLNDILDLSKIEANRFELNIQPLNLLPFLNDVCLLADVTARDKNLDFQIDTDGPIPSVILSDPTRLRQVLLNLLMNAIKFTSSGKVVLRVESAGVRQTGMLKFAVSDTGIGISKIDLENIFQPFYQAKKKHIGTGLGLTISKEIISRLGGSIEASSEKGGGSTFKFDIAVDVDADVADVDFLYSSHAEQVITDFPEAIPSFTGRVLIVDDLRDVRNLIGHFISATGLEVDHAQDGAEAVAILRDQQRLYQAVFMDIHMPTMDGIEAIKILRSEGYNNPVVALTAANMRGKREEYLTSGFTHFLPKPIDRTVLYGLLDTIFARKLETVKTAASHMESSSPSSCRILVVDDAQDAAEAICDMLGALGHHARCANDAQSFYTMFSSFDPDLLLMDYHLPGDNGLDLARWAVKKKGALRVVMLTGEELEITNSSNIEQVLLKPISLRDLVDVLSTFK